MQVLEREQDFRRIKPETQSNPCELSHLYAIPGIQKLKLCRESMGVKITATAILHHQAIELVGLEVRIKGWQEGVIKKAKDFPFCLRSDQFIPGDDRSPVHELHCKVCVGALKLYKINAPYVAIAQPLEQSEVGKTERWIP